MNIKSLAIKNNSDTDEPKVAYIEFEGEGVITAADIQADADIEIMNPDQVIATLSGGADSKFYMELTITKGRGYVSADKNKNADLPIGVIAVDSIYTPVERVNMAVANTRVGQQTDYDKLTLEIYTNGTLAPDEAVSLAAKVLSEHLNLFIDLSENAKTAEIMVEKEDNEKEKVLEMNIDELELSVRSYNCLKRAGINTVEELCKLLEVSRSGYYKWLKRKDKPDRDKIVADLIAECHEKAHRTYGYRRVKIWLLRETGLVINHKAVLRIMRKYNLLAIRKRKRFRHYDCNTYTHYANELMRDFTATRPNEKWVTDISYIQTKQGFLYLSMIKDLYDNSIVGYRYATQMPASLVIETVRAAVKNAKPSGGLILHSDNGFQYTSLAYYNVAKANGIKPSMSSIGCPYDNACAENFFSMLKTECIYRAKPQTFDEAKELVDEYIYFYNNERIQLKTGLTPMEVRYAYAA